MALRPRSLREHRLAGKFTAVRLAQRIGMDADDYARAEKDHRWNGTDRQTLGLLRQAVEGRWKQHTTALARLAGAPERRVAQALRTLHQEYAGFNERYMGHLVARNDNARLREIATERAAWLLALTDRFLHLVGDDGGGPATR
ncbi:hypothetical protein ACFVZW_09320 [Streptomyces sp. NPDC059567]|uniref:hypothetical protein n=1 Tax=Streptomyces sp. NPDC059567 TaxID=3346867 RepID=UPI0036B3A8DE